MRRSLEKGKPRKNKKIPAKLGRPGTYKKGAPAGALCFLRNDAMFLKKVRVSPMGDVAGTLLKVYRIMTKTYL